MWFVSIQSKTEKCVCHNRYGPTIGCEDTLDIVWETSSCNPVNKAIIRFQCDLHCATKENAQCLIDAKSAWVVITKPQFSHNRITNKG